MFGGNRISIPGLQLLLVQLHFPVAEFNMKRCAEYTEQEFLAAYFNSLLPLQESEHVHSCNSSSTYQPGLIPLAK